MESAIGAEDEGLVDVDDEEFWRCGVLRGKKDRVTSSALKESIFSPPFLTASQRGKGCTLGADATAVIGARDVQ